MEITVISEEENPMLHRTDVRFRVSHAEATPDRLAIRDSLAARLNKDADEVVVRKLDTKFGMRETMGEAKVYQGADFAKDVEQDYQLSRNKIGEDVEDTAEDVEDAAEPEVDDEVDADAEPEPESEPEEETADEEAPEADTEEAADEDEPEEAEAEDAGGEDEAEAAEDEAADADADESEGTEE